MDAHRGFERLVGYEIECGGPTWLQAAVLERRGPPSAQDLTRIQADCPLLQVVDAHSRNHEATLLPACDRFGFDADTTDEPPVLPRYRDFSDSRALGPEALGRIQPLRRMANQVDISRRLCRLREHGHG